MLFVTEGKAIVEERPGELVVEASSLGIPAGAWPDRIAVGTPAQGFHFFRGIYSLQDGGVMYRSLRDKTTLAVLND